MDENVRIAVKMKEPSQIVNQEEPTKILSGANYGFGAGVKIAEIARILRCFGS